VYISPICPEAHLVRFT